ncbi:hypothetical protein DBR42_09850 [Pelomonas sp. HMWF004]|nr:hypothetical protein DBR42_09850 [Pelomonas sp. HMWF004]
MSHKDMLYAWLQANRPDVFAQIDQDCMNDMRVLPILNHASGLGGTPAEVLSGETVESGSRRFLEAFRAQA